MSEEPLIAVFVDYENLALGARDSKWRTLDIDLILKRLLEKGRIVYKRAYCDWSQYRGDVREFHARGIELIDIPRSKMSGKNSADIRMVVDVRRANVPQRRLLPVLLGSPTVIADFDIDEA